MRKWKHNRKLKLQNWSRISLYRMAKVYVQKLLEEEQRKAVDTIQKGPHVPNDRQYHRSPSKRNKPDNRKMTAEEAEFDSLNQKAFLNDTDYFRWLALNPRLSAAEKRRLTTIRREQMAKRKKPATAVNSFIVNKKQAARNAVTKHALSYADWLKSKSKSKK